MANPIDDIKPAGGGDYADLASWDAANIRTDAQVFNGGDAGLALVNGTNMNLLRIFAEAASRHNGIADGGDCARIDNITNASGLDLKQSNIEVIGLYLHVTGVCNSSTQGIEAGSGVQNPDIRDCIVEIDATGTALKQGIGKFDSSISTSGSTILNNYVVFQAGAISTSSLLRGITTGVNAGQTQTFDEFSYNTVIDNSGNGDNGIRDDAENIMSQFHGNAVLGFVTPYSNVASFPNASKNASTGASTPGDGPVNSLVAADQVVDLNSDPAPKAGSSLLAVGTVRDLAELQADIRGTSRVGKSWDIGCTQVSNGANPIRGRWSANSGIGVRRPGHLIGRLPA